MNNIILTNQLRQYEQILKTIRRYVQREFCCGDIYKDGLDKFSDYSDLYRKIFDSDFKHFTFFYQFLKLLKTTSIDILGHYSYGELFYFIHNLVYFHMKDFDCKRMDTLYYHLERKNIDDTITEVIIDMSSVINETTISIKKLGKTKHYYDPNQENVRDRFAEVPDTQKETTIKVFLTRILERNYYNEILDRFVRGL